VSQKEREGGVFVPCSDRGCEGGEGRKFSSRLLGDGVGGKAPRKGKGAASFFWCPRAKEEEGTEVSVVFNREKSGGVALIRVEAKEKGRASRSWRKEGVSRKEGVESIFRRKRFRRLGTRIGGGEATFILLRVKEGEGGLPLFFVSPPRHSKGRKARGKLFFSLRSGGGESSLRRRRKKKREECAFLALVWRKRGELQFSFNLTTEVRLVGAIFYLLSERSEVKKEEGGRELLVVAKEEHEKRHTSPPPCRLGERGGGGERFPPCSSRFTWPLGGRERVALHYSVPAKKKEKPRGRRCRTRRWEPEREEAGCRLFICRQREGGGGGGGGKKGGGGPDVREL